MSQPNIPNISPTITVTREDAVNLILSSVAYGGIGAQPCTECSGGEDAVCPRYTS